MIAVDACVVISFLAGESGGEVEAFAQIAGLRLFRVDPKAV